MYVMDVGYWVAYYMQGGALLDVDVVKYRLALLNYFSKSCRDHITHYENILAKATIIFLQLNTPLGYFLISYD